jgi:hypothetical protein
MSDLSSSVEFLALHTNKHGNFFSFYQQVPFWVVLGEKWDGVPLLTLELLVLLLITLHRYNSSKNKYVYSYIETHSRMFQIYQKEIQVYSM